MEAEEVCRGIRITMSNASFVSPLQGSFSITRVSLGAYATKLWSVALLGLYGSDEPLRGVSLRSTPSLYYFAHKGLVQRHQSVHSVNSLENRSCSFPSSRKSAFHLNLRHLRNLRAIHSNISVFSASLCGKKTNPVYPFPPIDQCSNNSQFSIISAFSAFSVVQDFPVCCCLSVYFKSRSQILTGIESLNS